MVSPSKVWLQLAAAIVDAGCFAFIQFREQHFPLLVRSAGEKRVPLRILCGQFILHVPYCVQGGNAAMSVPALPCVPDFRMREQHLRDETWRQIFVPAGAS